MAMICKSGCAECTGCMRCYKETEPIITEPKYCTCCAKEDDGFHTEYDGELYCEECYAELLQELKEIEEADAREEAAHQAA